MTWFVDIQSTLKQKNGSHHFIHCTPIGWSPLKRGTKSDERDGSRMLLGDFRHRLHHRDGSGRVSQEEDETESVCRTPEHHSDAAGPTRARDAPQRPCASGFTQVSSTSADNCTTRKFALPFRNAKEELIAKGEKRDRSEYPTLDEVLDDIWSESELTQSLTGRPHPSSESQTDPDLPNDHKQ